MDHVDGRGVVRLVDQHRQLVVGEGHILDGRWRISATPISTGTVRVRGLKIEVFYDQDYKPRC